MRLLQGFRRADGPPEPDGVAIEVERLVPRPHLADDGAGLREVADGLGGRDQGHAVGLELPHRGVRAGQPAAPGADPENKPAARDDVDRRRHLREQGRGTQAVAGHDDAQPQPGCLGGQGGEERPRLQRRSGDVPAQRDHVIPQPGVLEDGNLVCLAPDVLDLAVGKAHLAGLDAKAQSLVRCGQPGRLLLPTVRLADHHYY